MRRRPRPRQGTLQMPYESGHATNITTKVYDTTDLHDKVKESCFPVCSACASQLEQGVNCESNRLPFVRPCVHSIAYGKYLLHYRS